MMRRRLVREDGGWLTIWGLGLAVMLIAVAGLAVDLWRVFEVRQDLGAMADSAAAAGASGLDERAYRDHARLGLDVRRAGELAYANLAVHSRDEITDQSVRVHASGVEVEVSGRVPFTLLRLFDPAGDFEITVTGFAEPRKSP